MRKRNETRIYLDYEKLSKATTHQILVFIYGMNEDMKMLSNYIHDLEAYVDEKRFDGLSEKDIRDAKESAKAEVKRQEEAMELAMAVASRRADDGRGR